MFVEIKRVVINNAKCIGLDADTIAGFGNHAYLFPVDYGFIASVELLAPAYTATCRWAINLIGQSIRALMSQTPACRPGGLHQPGIVLQRHCFC